MKTSKIAFLYLLTSCPSSTSSLVDTPVQRNRKSNSNNVLIPDGVPHRVHTARLLKKLQRKATNKKTRLQEDVLKQTEEVLAQLVNEQQTVEEPTSMSMDIVEQQVPCNNLTKKKCQKAQEEGRCDWVSEDDACVSALTTLEASIMPTEAVVSTTTATSYNPTDDAAGTHPADTVEEEETVIIEEDVETTVISTVAPDKKKRLQKDMLQQLEKEQLAVVTDESMSMDIVEQLVPCNILTKKKCQKEQEEGRCDWVAEDDLCIPALTTLETNVSPVLVNEMSMSMPTDEQSTDTTDPTDAAVDDEDEEEVATTTTFAPSGKPTTYKPTLSMQEIMEKQLQMQLEMATSKTTSLELFVESSNINAQPALVVNTMEPESKSHKGRKEPNGTPRSKGRKEGEKTTEKTLVHAISSNVEHSPLTIAESQHAVEKEEEEAKVVATEEVETVASPFYFKAPSSPVDDNTLVFQAPLPDNITLPLSSPVELEEVENITDVAVEEAIENATTIAIIFGEHNSTVAVGQPLLERNVWQEDKKSRRDHKKAERQASRGRRRPKSKKM